MSREVEWRNGIGKRLRPDGSYRYVIRWNDRTGQKRTETMPEGTPFREVQAARAERLREARSGLSHRPETLAAFVDEVFWLVKEKKLRPSTLRSYRSCYTNHLESFFGRRKLRDISLATIQEWVDRSELHPSTLRRNLAVLQEVTKAAAVRGRMASLDYRALELPAQRKYDHHYLTLAQLHAVAEMVGGWYEPDVIFLGITGLRFGEYRCLLDSDVDLEAGKIAVTKTLDQEMNLNPTKTEAGERIIDLHAPAAEAFRLKRRLKLEAGLAACPLAFPNRQGRPVNNANFHVDQWQPSIRELGLQGVRPHDLRHTAASLMARHGANVFYVQHQLGHASPIITKQTYTHLFDEHSDEMRDRINAAYEVAR
jgi:integrase